MKLEKDRLWHEALVVTEYVNGILGGFSEDEQWTYVSKLRNRSFDLTSNIAEGLGSVDPRDKTYAFGLARRDSFGIKNALVVANKTGRIEVDMAILAKLETVADTLDTYISESDKAIQPFLQKFSLKETTE